MAATGKTNAKLRNIRLGIWTLGFVSMFMDMSSEMIHALLPVYLVTVLGTSALTVGFIEGIAEATAMITKIFSGVLSDFLGKRQAARCNRLRPRCFRQAHLSAGNGRELVCGCALRRSNREGQSRCAS